MGLRSVAGYSPRLAGLMIRWGGCCNKIPCPLVAGYGLFSFLPSAMQVCCSQKTKNPSFASLRGDFVEVGGGFEPPFPVLQTDS